MNKYSVNNVTRRQNFEIIANAFQNNEPPSVFIHTLCWCIIYATDNTDKDEKYIILR